MSGHPDCPSANDLAAYLDGHVSADERYRLESHLADCGDCRFVVAESVRVDHSKGGRPMRMVCRACKGIVAVDTDEGVCPLCHSDALVPDIHPSTQAVLKFFSSGHLPEDLRRIAGPFEDLAFRMATTLEGPELTAGLRKLLEAKDCMVRAALP